MRFSIISLIFVAGQNHRRPARWHGPSLAWKEVHRDDREKRNANQHKIETKGDVFEITAGVCLLGMFKRGSTRKLARDPSRQGADRRNVLRCGCGWRRSLIVEDCAVTEENPGSGWMPVALRKALPGSSRYLSDRAYRPIQGGNKKAVPRRRNARRGPPCVA